MAGPFLHPAELTAIADRPPHHAGQFGNDLVIRRAKRRHTGTHQCDPFIQRSCGPGGLRRPRRADGGACRLVIHRLADGHNRPVDWRNAADFCHGSLSYGQARSKPRATS